MHFLTAAAAAAAAITVESASFANKLSAWTETRGRESEGARTLQYPFVADGSINHLLTWQWSRGFIN